MPLVEDQVAKLMSPELVGLNPPVPPQIVPADMRVHFFADAICLLGTLRGKVTRSKSMRGELKTTSFFNIMGEEHGWSVNLLDRCRAVKNYA